MPTEAGPSTVAPSPPRAAVGITGGFRLIVQEAEPLFCN